MSHVNQYEDFESVQHVCWMLGEFVVVNAAFSFATDICAQKLEGRWFCACCRPVVESQDGAELQAATEKAKDGVAAGPAAAASDADLEAAAANTAADPELAARVAAPEDMRWDVSRSCRFAATGVFFCGVVQFIRLAVIDVVFDRTDTSMRTAVYKTLMNQIVFSPIVRAWSMMTVRYMYERARNRSVSESWSGACANLQDKFCEAQGVSYAVKPISNFLAFAMFPNHILGQAVVMRTVAFVYNVYFDYLVHSEQAEKEKAAIAEGDPTEEADGEGKEGAETEMKEKKVDRASQQCCLCQSCSVM